MRWREGRRSDNVEDQRGSGVRKGAIGGGIGILIILAIGLLMGADPGTLLTEIVGESGSSLDGMTSPYRCQRRMMNRPILCPLSWAVRKIPGRPSLQKEGWNHDPAVSQTL